jgi:hypothetical protein
MSFVGDIVSIGFAGSDVARRFEFDSEKVTLREMSPILVPLPKGSRLLSLSDTTVLSVRDERSHDNLFLCDISSHLALVQVPKVPDAPMSGSQRGQAVGCLASRVISLLWAQAPREFSGKLTTYAAEIVENGYGDKIEPGALSCLTVAGLLVLLDSPKTPELSAVTHKLIDKILSRPEFLSDATLLLIMRNIKVMTCHWDDEWIQHVARVVRRWPLESRARICRYLPVIASVPAFLSFVDPFLLETWEKLSRAMLLQITATGI